MDFLKDRFSFTSMTFLIKHTRICQLLNKKRLVYSDKKWLNDFYIYWLLALDSTDNCKSFFGVNYTSIITDMLSMDINGVLGHIYSSACKCYVTLVQVLTMGVCCMLLEASWVTFMILMPNKYIKESCSKNKTYLTC